MASKHIQIGIDLGTTNSEIAINTGDSIEIVKNGFNDEYTPSVFGVDKSNNKIVGKKSYERLYKHASDDELKNNKAEVKRIMGTSETVNFSRLNQDLKPEEISAEILKSLKEDVLRKYSEFNTVGAVITIPAHFSTLQAEATKRAANLAGFEYAVLIQEPIAAAIAYGFMESKNENWLVYDLGGGTFDVALVSSKSGDLSVLAQNGDNFLGGKDFDNLVIEKVLIPSIQKEFSCLELKKDKVVYSKLKHIAEIAKVELTSYEKTNIQIENIGDDDDGKEIYVSIDFSRNDLENLIKPLIDRTIKLSKETIKDSGVKKESITKIVLVGGPTLIPYVREKLEKELKIEVDTSVDPLTVVARGACVYGVSQQIPDELFKNKKQEAGTHNIKLFYDSLTSDTEVVVSGLVESLKEEDGYYIQIQNDSGTYNSSKISLKEGKFFNSITLDENKSNLFWIYLFDEEGNTIKIDPDSFNIIHGLSVRGAPIPHSVGVGVVDKDHKTGISSEIFHVFFEKNSELPLKKTETFHTVRKLKKGDTENALPIKVYEGNSERNDRNQRICDLKITGENIPYDLPEKTPVDITISINESREVSVNAYIESIDLSIDARASIHDENLNTEQMQDELNIQKIRIEKAKSNCTKTEKEDLEDLHSSISSSLDRAEDDEDEKRKANKKIKDLKILLDSIEKEKELPQLISEFRELIIDTGKMINDVGDREDLNKNNDLLKALKDEGENAIEENDKHLLIRVIEQLRDLKQQVVFSNPASWAYLFNKIIKEHNKFISEKEAQYFIDKGLRAIELNDTEELKRCTRGLLLLLPPEEQHIIENSMPGITY